MNEPKPDYHLVSFSGGKDSTAMLLRMIEEGMPIDEILFCDTGLEFPDLYGHIEKVEKYIGRTITRIRADHDFEYYFARHPIKRRSEKFLSQYGGNLPGFGWMGPKMRWCTNRLKDAPRDAYLRRLKKRYNVIQYIGIAADETERLNRKNNLNPLHRHPLADWGMTENDCLRFCYDRGFDWNGLYTMFQRVSCWCCPLQGLPELRMLRSHFPELWNQLRAWDDSTWRKYRADYSVRELEKRFDLEEVFLANGKSVNDRAFFDALRKKLEESDNE